MPRGDRSGPMGMGARTGRGLGYCSGADAPGFAGQGPQPGGYRNGGRGAGMGRGIRGGRGCWNTGYPVAPAAPAAPLRSGEQEQQYLQQQADMLQSELETIKQRLADLEMPKSNT